MYRVYMEQLEAPTPQDIRKLREFYGDSREEFGSRFNKSKHTVRAWEKDYKVPGHRNMDGSARVIYYSLKEYMDDQ